ncbi:hypothetical protein R1L06_04315 [Stenotrophomonas sp. C4297]|uniref:HNH endonuclease n=1 Tax=Stenotrophomonas sp. C4297 TaxID=3077847 RepID=UPI00293CB3CB|nr:HNH endonuclease [Stenotrophomonas sp. C4297]MDV3509938.1 hypothetical protein [Stenotrophomonas sp. C4297]
MPFLQGVKDLIAYRAAYVCSNPDCLRLTAGPSLAGAALRVKIGEAAHIIGENPGSARHQPLGDSVLNDVTNAIWLCASCHAEIDKNKGVDHSESLLRQWKSDIEARIAAILKAHQSPLPLYERASSNSKIAQNIVEIIDSHGAFFRHVASEDPSAVGNSIKLARIKIERQSRLIEGDARLRSIARAIHDACRDYMNEVSIDNSLWESYLPVLRMRIWVQVKSLNREFGVIVPQNVSHLLP